MRWCPAWWLPIAWGPSEPASMPTSAASKPASCAGNTWPAGVARNNTQVNKPSTMANTAPWVVARFQYRPNTSGTKAPTKGTW